MFQLRKYSIIFIHREASPIGPPIFEWIIAKILKKKIIYDFDDAIWIKNTSQSNQFISGIKNHSKVTSICKWATTVFCGNHFLLDFAKNLNKNVVYIPTTIDTINLHNKIKTHSNKQIVIGWTGTHSTIKYLYGIEELLEKLQKEFNLKFLIISNQDPYFSKLKYNYTLWNKKNEIENLLKLDIGLMPLINNEWSKGKCGFKALQYMSLGIPCVISPIGVNTKIIKNGVNGYLADNEQEWIEKLTELITSKEQRSKIGSAGRETVLNNYSVTSVKDFYLDSFNELIN